MGESVSRTHAVSAVVLGLAIALGASAQTTGSSTATKSSTMKSASNPQKTLPSLQEHLQLAQQTNDAVKKAAHK